MAMIMSMQRLNEREGREGGSWANICRQDSDGGAAPRRWLQEQIEAHTFSQSRKREGETLLGREGGLRSAQVE